MGLFRTYCKRLLWGHKADSEGYLRYLRRKGMRIGAGTVVYDPRSVLIDETRPWMIELGRNVQISRGVSILSHGYEWAVLKAVYGEVLGSAGKVTIGDNVFLGVNAVILKGVSIGNNTVIGAGSVVTRDIPENCVAAGNPAQVRMTLAEYRDKRNAAQLPEVRELAAEYEAVYRQPPGEQALSEFFPLFANDPDSLPPCWEEKLELMGNGAFSRRVLRESQPKFQGLADFLAHGKSPRT